MTIVVQALALILATVPPVPPAAPASATTPVASPPAPTPVVARPPPAPSYLEFAKSLRRLGRYDACAVEALRHGYVHPEDQADAAELAALCLDLAHRYHDAHTLLAAFFPGTDLPPHARFRLCYTEVFLADGPSPRCQGPTAAAPDRYLGLAAYTPVMRSLVARRWDVAGEALARLPSAVPGTLGDWVTQDRHFLELHDRLPHRSPWLAAVLSAVVPGAGRVYDGRWGDGFMSFLLIGVPTGFGAWDFARQGVSSVGGWILASVAGLFYLGDVYGSAVGAVQFNRKQAAGLDRQIAEAYDGRADP